MVDALLRARTVELLLLVARLCLTEVRLLWQRLDLDDVRAELGGYLRGIGADVDRGLALARQVAAARIGPDHDGQPMSLGLAGHLGDVAHLVMGSVRAGIDRVTDRGAPQPQRVLDVAGDRLRRVFLETRHAVGVVELEDGRDPPGKGVCPGFDKAEPRGIGRKAGLKRKLIMVMRVVGRRVRRKAAGWAVLDPLVDRQDKQPAGAAGPAPADDAGEVRLGARIVSLVIVEDPLDRVGEFHRLSFLTSAPGEWAGQPFQPTPDAAFLSNQAGLGENLGADAA